MYILPVFPSLSDFFRSPSSCGSHFHQRTVTAIILFPMADWATISSKSIFWPTFPPPLPPLLHPPPFPPPPTRGQNKPHCSHAFIIQPHVLQLFSLESQIRRAAGYFFLLQHEKGDSVGFAGIIVRTLVHLVIGVIFTAAGRPFHYRRSLQKRMSRSALVVNQILLSERFLLFCQYRQPPKNPNKQTNTQKTWLKQVRYCGVFIAHLEPFDDQLPVIIIMLMILGFGRTWVGVITWRRLRTWNWSPHSRRSSLKGETKSWEPKEDTKLASTNSPSPHLR